MSDYASLRLALRLNACFSTCSAITMLVMTDALAELMGIPTDILIGVAVGLIGFAAYLLFTASRSDTEKLRRESLQHSLSDFAWVLGTVVVVALGLVTSTGNLILGGVALCVLVLGIAQWRGLSDDATDTGAVKA